MPYTLENSIHYFGYNSEIQIWNNMLLDSFDAYRFCVKYSKPFFVKRKAFRSYEDAISYLCAFYLNEMQDHLTSTMIKFLIGRQYISERILSQHQAQERRKNPGYTPSVIYEETALKMRKRFSAVYHVSEQTVYKYGGFAEAMVRIYSVSPELFTRIVSDKTKLAIEYVVLLSQMSRKEQKTAIHDLMLIKNNTYSYSRFLLKKEAQRRAENQVTSPPGSVKNMPEYNPDSPIKSLSFTVASWISSLERTRNQADLGVVSNTALLNLKEQLERLSSITSALLSDIKECLDD